MLGFIKQEKYEWRKEGDSYLYQFKEKFGDPESLQALFISITPQRIVEKLSGLHLRNRLYSSDDLKKLDEKLKYDAAFMVFYQNANSESFGFFNACLYRGRYIYGHKKEFSCKNPEDLPTAENFTKSIEKSFGIGSCSRFRKIILISNLPIEIENIVRDVI